MNPDEMRILDTIMAQRQFELGGEIGWKHWARWLKYSADTLYVIFDQAAKRDLARYLNRINMGMSHTGARILEGDELKDSNDMQLLHTYLLLAGLALENLLKASIVRRHPEALPKSGTLPKVLKTHDLIRLCSKCSIMLDENQIITMETLTQYIHWRGRYPIPTKQEDLMPKVGPDGMSRGSSLRARPEVLRDEIDKFYLYLWGEL